MHARFLRLQTGARLAFQIVANQLNVLIADGTAIAIVEIMKDVPNSGFIPLMNMW